METGVAIVSRSTGRIVPGETHNVPTGTAIQRVAEFAAATSLDAVPSDVINVVLPAPAVGVTPKFNTINPIVTRVSVDRFRPTFDRGHRRRPLVVILRL